MCETWLCLAARWVMVVRMGREVVMGPARDMMRLEGRGGWMGEDEGLWKESWLVRLEGMLLKSEVEVDGDEVMVLLLLMLRLQLMVDEG